MRCVFRQSSLFSSLAQNQIKMHSTQSNHICTSYFLFVCVCMYTSELVSDIHRDQRTTSGIRKMLVDIYASKTMMYMPFHTVVFFVHKLYKTTTTTTATTTVTAAIVSISKPPHVVSNEKSDFIFSHFLCIYNLLGYNSSSSSSLSLGCYRNYYFAFSTPARKKKLPER